MPQELQAKLAKMLDEAESQIDKAQEWFDQDPLTAMDWINEAYQMQKAVSLVLAFYV